MRTQVAAVLVRVGVADHHLLAVATRSYEVRIDGIREQTAEHVRRTAEIVDRLEQRHDVECRRGRLPGYGRRDETDLLEQDGDLEHVTDVVGHRDDVVGEYDTTDPVAGSRCFVEDREFGDGDVAVLRRRDVAAGEVCGVRPRAAARVTLRRVRCSRHRRRRPRTDPRSHARGRRSSGARRVRRDGRRTRRRRGERARRSGPRSLLHRGSATTR